MNTYYVATRARYVLVEAPNADAARAAARPGLADLHAEIGAKIGREVPIEIHTVRIATSDEIELEQWNQEMLAREGRH